MFIFFDLDDTLLQHSRASTTASLHFYDHFSHALTGQREDFPSIWKAALEKHFATITRGEVSYQEQRRNRIRDVFNDPTIPNHEADRRFAIYLRHYEANWSLFDDVLPCLESMRGMGLGVITNGITEQQNKKLLQTNIVDRFSVILVSESIGTSKPQPEIFLEACRRASIPPSNCIHIGDDVEKDVLGSQAAGLRSIWLNRSGLPKSALSVPTIPTLHHLQELLGIGK